MTETERSPYDDYFGGQADAWVITRVKRAWVPEWAWALVAHYVSPWWNGPAHVLSAPVEDEPGD